MAAKQYVFGYGSLINRESLLYTLKAHEFGEVVVGRIGDFHRSWSNRVYARGRTGLGVRREPGGSVNGAAIEMLASLAPIDAREAGYERVLVEHQDLVDGDLWVYTIANSARPSPEFPITLSYLECVLAGCLQVGEAFALEFIERTGQWEAPLWNDRADRQYPRWTPLDGETLATIDRLLLDNLPAEVSQSLKDG